MRRLQFGTLLPPERHVQDRRTRRTGRALAVAARGSAAHERTASRATGSGDPRARQPALAPQRRAKPHRRAPRPVAARSRRRRAERRRRGGTRHGQRRQAAQSRMKQVEATILGQSYILGCPEGGEAALLEAVAAVDREMSAIRDGGKVKARERIAVLAALNLAFALAELPAVAPPRNARGSSDMGKEADLPIDVDSLIRRLDMALGADGRLL